MHIIKGIALTYITEKILVVFLLGFFTLNRKRTRWGNMESCPIWNFENY